MKEADIQRECLEWLMGQESLGLLMVERRNNIPAPGRGLAKGAKRGSSDCEVLMGGRRIDFEFKASKDEHWTVDPATGEKKLCKRRDGVQSPEQKIYQDLVEKNGGYYYVARSLQEVQNIIAQHKKILSVAVASVEVPLE